MIDEPSAPSAHPRTIEDRVASSRASNRLWCREQRPLASECLCISGERPTRSNPKIHQSGPKHGVTGSALEDLQRRRLTVTSGGRIATDVLNCGERCESEGARRARHEFARIGWSSGHRERHGRIRIAKTECPSCGTTAGAYVGRSHRRKPAVEVSPLILMAELDVTNVIVDAPAPVLIVLGFSA